MGQTPLQGDPIPDGGVAPANSPAFAAYGASVEKRTVNVWTSAAARDAAILTANRKKGMVAFLGDVGWWTGVKADAGAWMPIAGVPSYRADQVGSFIFTAAYTDVPSATITLPAGQWQVRAAGTIDVSTTASRLYFMRVTDGVNENFTRLRPGLLTSTTFGGQYQFAAEMRVTYTATTTVKVQAYTDVVDGSQGLALVAITANPIIY